MASSKECLKVLPYFKQLLDLLETNEDIKRTIIDQGKWRSLKENIANNRENAEWFREQFCASYAGYLESVLGQVSWAASGAGVGGLVAGPPGALVGGIAGSVIGYMRSDDYSSMLDVLRCLTDVEKENLVNEVQGLVGSAAVEDLTSFIGSPDHRELLVNCIREFIKACSAGDREPDSEATSETSTTDRPPPYNPDWAHTPEPSAPVLPSEDYPNATGEQVYPDPPPPYTDDRRIYPDLNIPANKDNG